MAPDSPWLTGDAASAYVSAGATTKQHRRKYGPRFLAKQVRDGNLCAARVGGRGELLYRREWLDEWILARATAIPITARRRA